MPAAKPIAILSTDHALRQSLAFALASEGFSSETFADGALAERDHHRFLCVIVDEQALPGMPVDLAALAVPVILLADGLGSRVDIAGARVIYKPLQGADILSLVRSLAIPA